MADLLECLIQIKGVADTPRRLALRLSATAAAADPDAPARGLRVARRMAEAETRFRECLSLMLAHERPAVPALPRIVAVEREDRARTAREVGRDAFAERRAGTVAVLERCSAEQLGRIGLEPTRGPMTVADLVAVMLAHDTDCLGEI